MPAAPIDILLATFNGGIWLPALLASLEQQTCQDWRLLVRDDGSHDGTLELLQTWQQRLGDRMTLVAGAKPLLPGPMGNFARLLEAATAPYVMFCDQDDVWLPTKVARSLDTMRASEARHGTTSPILIFSDLRVVDAELRPLAESFWQSQFLRPTQVTYRRLLVQNVVTGCTLMANRSLVTRASPIPAEAFMHDWWFALVAAAFGRLEPIREPLILYRQHSNNAVGAQCFKVFPLVQRILRGEVRSYLRETGRQAAAMHRQFGAGLGALRAPTEALADLDRQGWLTRKWRMVAHRLFIFGWFRNLAWLLVS